MQMKVDEKVFGDRFESLFCDEHGFTTVGMVLALLISLSLVFATAQVYRVNTLSAEVQDIADAAALSAQTQVAEFMIAARVCDAVVLTLSLTGLASVAIGTVASCIPPTAALSKALMKAGKNLLKARDDFAKRAQQTLERMQEALPFFAAACAAAVASSNNRVSAGSKYYGVAVLVPAKGEAIEVDSDEETADLVDEAQAQADEIRERAREAEEAAQAANRSKQRAFERDCGDAPEYCMYERASHLAGLSDADNPLYSSVDAWSFSVALERARAYYAARLANEVPGDNSYKEQARSALRTRFYRYVVDELKSAYVHESSDSFEANIPHVPSNTREMRFTSLYTDQVYPISTNEDGSSVMHAWPGCPEAAATLERGSIQQLEQGDFEKCHVCEFTASSMGSVAAASSSIANGFEYHYEAVADEAINYQRERARADEPKSRVKELVEGLFEKLEEVAKKAAGKRIEVSPPGRYGVVAFVVNLGASDTDRFASGFLKVRGSLGPRAAVSAATLVDEGSDEGSTILSSLLDGFKEDAGVVAGAAGIVLSCWSNMLTVYGAGQSAIEQAVETGLNAVPLAGASGLGTWAAGALRDAVESLGLQPAELGALKPVLVNSAHVAAKDSGALAQGLLRIKGALSAAPLMSTDLFSSLITAAQAGVESKIDALGDSIEVASIDLTGDGGVSLPITIPIPAAVRSAGMSAVEAVFDSIRQTYVTASGVKVWE